MVFWVSMENHVALFLALSVGLNIFLIERFKVATVWMVLKRGEFNSVHEKIMLRWPSLCTMWPKSCGTYSTMWPKSHHAHTSNTMQSLSTLASLSPAQQPHLHVLR